MKAIDGETIHADVNYSTAGTQFTLI